MMVCLVSSVGERMPLLAATLTALITSNLDSVDIHLGLNGGSEKEPVLDILQALTRYYKNRKLTVYPYPDNWPIGKIKCGILSTLKGREERILLMDDDCIPDFQGLEKLLSAPSKYDVLMPCVHDVSNARHYEDWELEIEITEERWRSAGPDKQERLQFGNLKLREGTILEFAPGARYSVSRSWIRWSALDRILPYWQNYPKHVRGHDSVGHLLEPGSGALVPDCVFHHIGLLDPHISKVWHTDPIMPDLENVSNARRP